MDVFYYHLEDIKNQLNHIEKLVTSVEKYDKWLSLKDAKEYSSLSVSTLRRAIAKGELKASRKSGKILLKRNNIDKFLGS